MKYKNHLILIFCLILLSIAPWVHVAKAQVQDGEWSSISRLSTNKGKASEAALVADKYGNVHVFWAEEMDDLRTIIQYATYEGETWSTPTDIYVTRPFQPINNISPIVDSSGTLHLVWSEGISGSAYYTSVPAHVATSSQRWQPPRLLKVPANRAKLQVDSKGFLHILYIKFLGLETGIYYMRSEDQGINWTEPVWLDPDILPGYGPRALNFEMDDSGGLHAAWYYVPIEDLGGDWVRYTHSLDGGITWSQPFTIDRLDEEALANDESLSAAGPIMVVQGQNVHIIWAGGKLHYRQHRYSTDAGRSWNESRRIFGELNGQAFEGLTVDAAGRVHYFGQIRFPMGIYHAIWDDGAWTRPSLIYLIRLSPTDLPDGRIEAHNTHPVVRSGNQVVLTFTDSPSSPDRRLFVMVKTLEDIPTSEALPTPTPLITNTLQPTAATIQPTAVATRLPFGDSPLSSDTAPTGEPLLFGFVATLILAGSAITIRMIKMRS